MTRRSSWGSGALPGTVLAAGHVTASVSIIDDDLPEVSVGFEQSSYTVAEGRSVTVRALLSAEPERPLDIQLTAVEQEGATSTDYSGVPASVTFTEEETEQTFTFTATTDDTYEAGESVLFGLAALPERVRAGDIAETTVLISEDDLPQVAVSFDARSATVAEGGRVRVSLSLSADPKRTVTIPITVTNRGGATDRDHTGVPPRVTFEAGETAQTLTLRATRDSDEDDGEWVVLGFDALPEGVSSGAIDAVTVTIREGARSSGGSVGGGGGGSGGGSSGGGGPVNRAPVFEDADGSALTETARVIAEDAAPGTNIGEPVVATDPDEDTLTYSLSGDDAASFSIDPSTGQLTTATALNHETKASYSVTVIATDPSGATAEVEVTITVTVTEAEFDCSTGNAVADAADNPGLVADCEALLKSRDRLAGDASLNWSEDTSIAEWDGVRLSGTPQRVTRLYLARRGLTGTMPADLGSLSTLTGLYLHHNELTGPIPSQLGELSRPGAPDAAPQSALGRGARRAG